MVISHLQSTAHAAHTAHSTAATVAAFVITPASASASAGAGAGTVIGAFPEAASQWNAIAAGGFSDPLRVKHGMERVLRALASGLLCRFLRSFLFVKLSPL